MQTMCYNFSSIHAGVVERSNTADCKSVGIRLRGFESLSLHHIALIQTQANKRRPGFVHVPGGAKARRYAEEPIAVSVGLGRLVPGLWPVGSDEGAGVAHHTTFFAERSP